MFGTQHQRNAVRSSIGLVVCLIASAIVESQSLAQDVAPVAESQAAPDSQPPAFANNDRFHNITVKAKISDRFEIYDPHSVEQLQAIRDMGFRQVIFDWPNLHREATQLGLDVVIANWWTIDTEVSEIEKRMEFVREIDPERFAAVSMMDEPEVWSKTPGFIDGFRDLMSELTTWTRRYKGQVADTLMSPDGILQSKIAASDHQHVTIRINTNRIQTGAMPGLAIWTYCD